MNPLRPKLSGLYVITDDSAPGPVALRTAVTAAIRGGARVVQYRDKSDDPARRLDEARALRGLTREHEVPLLINDDVALAHAVDADGVHLGRDDDAIAAARAVLGEQRLIGISCYNSFDLASDAIAAGADYIAFGSFFASPTKPDAVHADIELLRRARAQLRVPTVAIGGISPENGAALVAAGADMLAVISAVFGATDVDTAASAFACCFDVAKETYP